MTTLSIYRPGAPVILQATVEIDEKTVYQKKLMTDHKIVSEFISASILPIQIGDYITYNSENYYINRLPDIEKISSVTFKYKIDFESVLHNLGKKLFISSDGLADFSYNGNADDLLTLILSNINEIDPGWSKGTIESTDSVTFMFANESCRAALERVVKEFNLEYTVVGRSISLVKQTGAIKNYTFQYGKGNGLYKITGQQVNNQNIVTKVYAYGGTKNIPSDYRDRAKRLVFEERFLTANTGVYGIIEGHFTDDNIYPQRTGTITAQNIVFFDGVFYNKLSSITDSSLDFDINDYLIEGMTATIVFKTGDLAGVECEIWKYDHITKRIYFNPYSDADGYTLPNYNEGSPLQPKIGDTYTLINISLPQSYIDLAEARLRTKALEYLTENCVPQVVYSVEIDPHYALQNSIIIDAGDQVRIIDSDFGINTHIRVSDVEFPLVNPFQIKAIIADFVPYTLQERIIQAAVNTKKETVIIDRKSAELARRNTLRQNQLKELLFDPDGYFDPVNIRPLSIETLNLSVGAKSINFRLSGVTIDPNHAGNINELTVSAGSLVHFQLAIGGSYTWVIGNSATFSSLDPEKAYYLYAKCDKAALTGTWILAEDKKLADAGDGYYYFLCGVLFAVLDGVREFENMYGVTYINGSVITTGRIRSIDGLNYIDLDQNQVRMGNETSFLDWNVTSPDTLILKGTLVQSPGGTTAPILVNRGTYNAGTTYYKGEQVTYSGNTWNYINTTPAAGQTPSEGSYWTLASSGGVGPAGPAVCYRGPFSASTPYFNNAVTRDVVKYGSTYYFYIGSDNTAGAWNPANFQSVGSSWSSVATGLLLAELAYIDNLGVKYFNGIPVPAGDLSGTVQNITPNGYLSTEWDENTLYRTGHKCSNGGINYIAIAESTGVQPPDASYWSSDPVQPQKRVDKITLSGTSGTASVVCDGITKLATWNDNGLPATATDFVALYSAAYLAGGVVVTSDGADIVFTAQTAGINFSGTTSITNTPDENRGSVKITGNSIFNDTENSDYGTIRINMKGHNGGLTKYRRLLIGDGRGGILADLRGNIWGGLIALKASKFLFTDIPTSAAGLDSGQIYNDNGTLKIVP